MSTAVFVISVIGLVLAAVSLTWQAASFALAGSRVKVELVHGFRGPGVGAWLGRPGWAVSSAQFATLGYNEEIVGVRVRNAGRMAATVVNADVEFENGALYRNPSSPWNPPPRLDAGEQATWPLEAHAVRGFVAAAGTDFMLVRAQVGLGTGRTKSSPWIGIGSQPLTFRLEPKRRWWQRLVPRRQRPR